MWSLFHRARALLMREDEAPSTLRALTLLLCAVGVALGVLWRFQDLHYPASFTFDEHHFVENARNYLRGAPDWNDHPPLGKLLMLPGMLIFGDNGVGWRVHAPVLGSLHLVCVFVVAAALFGDRRTGLLAAAFVAIDGLFISYSRTALLDIPMNAFMMAALALMLVGRAQTPAGASAPPVPGRRGLALFAGAAVAIGLAVAVKWIAVCLALVVPWLLRRQGRSVLHALWMGVIAVAVYFGVVALALRLTHQPVSPRGLVQSSLELLRHHAAFTDWRNPIDSRWYTWPFLHKPFLFHREVLPGGRLRLMSSVGNPWLWYLTTAAFALSAVALARGLWRRLTAATALPAPLRREGLLLYTAVALVLQWILSNRESYLWHYMGTYSIGLILLAGYFAPSWRAQAGRILVVVSVALAVAVFYAPVWTYGVLSTQAAHWRLFAPAWW